ncbi:Vacuolar protein sorting-associated protein 62 [Senna tora]|uniref:Vacuolar protein sorting-associated protein 62 n=1 Tax=Senna tora TaxID=362788 RepID=A0A834X0V5_9FABA|nr:Vacuolar protein sorting-associated protein 62 [Senna tora]
MGNANVSEKKRESMPIDTSFKLPSHIPVWPQGDNGDGFGSGIIDLGGLKVCQISTFNKIWTTLEGGPNNAGATFFEPTGIPEGFFMLGCYGQPNKKPLFGCVLAAKDDLSSSSSSSSHDTLNGALAKPVDYTLVYSSKSQKIKQEQEGYIWLPTPPDGYKAVGHLVTTTPDKPSLDKIRCVRSDFTEECDVSSWIWGPNKNNNIDPKGFNVYDVRPSNRGIKAPGVLVGTFLAQKGETKSETNTTTTSSVSISCLKNTKPNFSSSMPNLPQIKALIQAYSPLLHLHPNEDYLPSSVNWFFTNGALLYNQKDTSKPVPIDQNGSNLPQGGTQDGAYWLDLPANKDKRDRVKKGDLQSSQAYAHIKPMFGGTFTDISMWVFFPFNGPATAKLAFFIDLPLGQIGEHVGDWEHLTLRISNFNGELKRVYFSQHSKGTWVDSSELEFQNGNKPVAYSSFHGHAMYPRPGVIMQGNRAFGIKNEAMKSDKVLDLGVGLEIVGGEYLDSAITEPPWLNYTRQWGPKIRYDAASVIQNVEKILPWNVKFPNELSGEEGPTGPKMKINWNGDEAS